MLSLMAVFFGGIQICQAMSLRQYLVLQNLPKENRQERAEQLALQGKYCKHTKTTKGTN